jgi:hypothetical protein
MEIPNINHFAQKRSWILLFHRGISSISFGAKYDNPPTVLFKTTSNRTGFKICLVRQKPL